MGKVILGLTISLDGFAEDIHGSVNPFYTDLDVYLTTDLVSESIKKTGAVVMSFKEFNMADDPDGYAEYYEYQVPIFVFTDKLPEKHPKENDNLKFTFVTSGIEDTILQAKEAAGNKDVSIIGSALTTQLCLNTNLVDELQVDIIPVFFKNGFRPFELIEHKKLKLVREKVVELPAGRTHIRYKVNK